MFKIYVLKTSKYHTFDYMKIAFRSSPEESFPVFVLLARPNYPVRLLTGLSDFHSVQLGKSDSRHRALPWGQNSRYKEAPAEIRRNNIIMSY